MAGRKYARAAVRWMRTGAVQTVPSGDVEYTMSLTPELARKRPSCQATNSRPAASTATLGSAGARIVVSASASSSDAIRTGAEKVSPPSCEMTAGRWSSPLGGPKNEYGTTRSPFGRVTGTGPEKAEFVASG